MRTISVRLDDKTDALLRRLCAQGKRSQTDVLKEALERLAREDRPTPAELAEQHGLVGCFASTAGDLGENHSQRLKARLRAKHRAESQD